MKHPHQATLALHAGGDLGWWSRWSTDRHVAECDQCRNDVAGYRSAREVARDLNDIPEIQWNRLAAEMKANIRLGLAAGECVRSEEAPQIMEPFFRRVRPMVALASVLALLVTGIMLERPAPVYADDGVVVQATPDGIQMRRGGQAFRLMNMGARRVTYSSGAQGVIGAQSVDPDTGYVTINKVYVE